MHIEFDEQSQVAVCARVDVDGLPVSPGKYVIHPDGHPKAAMPITVFEDEVTFDLWFRTVVDRTGEVVQRVDELAEDTVFLRRNT